MLITQRVSKKGTKVRLAIFALALGMAFFALHVGGALATHVTTHVQCPEGHTGASLAEDASNPSPVEGEPPPGVENKEVHCYDGTAGPDRIVGSNDPQVIDDMRSFGGGDELRARGGFDALVGGNGADTLYGGNGPDGLYAADEEVLARGDKQEDTIYGGRGNDWVFARDTPQEGGVDVTPPTGGDPDIISCGRGKRDRYDVDPEDRVKPDCEIRFTEFEERHWLSQWLRRR